MKIKNCFFIKDDMILMMIIFITQIKICVDASGALFLHWELNSVKLRIRIVIFYYQNDTYLWGINDTKKIAIVKKVKIKTTI
ncbi:hypothetical protein [Clostridium felsineum]|nr:hypothetical protein [Clostridium felsineum]